jgi:hypothetical protein
MLFVGRSNLPSRVPFLNAGNSNESLSVVDMSSRTSLWRLAGHLEISLLFAVKMIRAPPTLISLSKSDVQETLARVDQRRRERSRHKAPNKTESLQDQRIGVNKSLDGQAGIGQWRNWEILDDLELENEQNERPAFKNEEATSNSDEDTEEGDGTRPTPMPYKDVTRQTADYEQSLWSSGKWLANLSSYEHDQGDKSVSYGKSTGERHRFAG